MDIMEFLSGEDDLNEKKIDMIYKHLSQRASKILEKQNIKGSEEEVTYGILKNTQTMLL